MNYENQMRELGRLHTCREFPEIQEAIQSLLTEVNTLLVSKEVKHQMGKYKKRFFDGIYSIGDYATDDSVYFGFMIETESYYDFTFRIEPDTINSMLLYSLLVKSCSNHGLLYFIRGFLPSEIIEATKEQLIKISGNEY